MLDLRAESLIAEGRFHDAARDAAEMLALAGADAPPAHRIVALMRDAVVRMRLSEHRRALQSAQRAEALADTGRDARLQARSLLCLAEAQLRSMQSEAAVATAQRAAAMFEAAGAAAEHGRAHWVIAFAQTRLSRNEESRKAAQRAVALAREAGDDQGLANALNVLSFSSADIAERLALLRQAAQAFERAGDAFGRMVVLGNLSLAFAELGLWRNAMRVNDQSLAASARMGARLQHALAMGVGLYWTLMRGDVSGARAQWPAYDDAVTALDEPLPRNDRELWAAALARPRASPALPSSVCAPSCAASVPRRRASSSTC